ncbi:hypothetical protein [Neisseria yangbaofengii]|uniref:hypothetical protein n=1 Tax=Neisseria yangbaofengii TaxID=2709396 RepID=UPI0013EE36BB|nr:hypothetical protein [Neisseria yangbaofengii]
MKNHIIGLIIGILTTVVATIIISWINSGNIKYEYSFNSYDRLASILSINIENNSSQIEKDIHIILPGLFLLTKENEEDIKMRSSLSNTTMKIIDRKIEIAIPSLRQKEKGEIQLLFLGGAPFSDYSLDNELLITSETTIAKRENYLFTDKNFHNTVFLLVMTVMATFISLLLIDFISDYLTSYESKKNSLIENLNNLMKNNKENKIVSLISKDDGNK